jgi:hypothetical protein
MNDQLSMFDPTTSEDTPNAISSPGSAAGPVPSGSPGGTTIGPSGQEAARASRSQSPASKKAQPTSATSGPLSTISSESAALSQFLANKLAARMVSTGSTLYTLIWKVQTTASGRRFYRLAASGRRTSASEYGSWPTPIVNDVLGSQYCYGKGKSGQRIKFLKLPGAALLASTWLTPKLPSGGGQTERTTTGGGLRKLEDQVLLAHWPTPNAMEGGQTSRRGKRKGELLMGGLVQSTASGETPNGSPAETINIGQLNPALSRWLQAYPEAWDIASPNYDAWLAVQEAIASDASKDTGTP